MGKEVLLFDMELHTKKDNNQNADKNISGHARASPRLPPPLHIIYAASITLSQYRRSLLVVL